MPFADTGSVIAGLLQQIGDGDFVQVHPVLVAGKHYGRDADTTIMPTGKQRSPRPGTNRTARVKAVKANAFLGHLVDVRCLETLATVTTNIGIALIVRKNQNDVGLLLSLNGRNETDRQADSKSKEESFFHGHPF